MATPGTACAILLVDDDEVSAMRVRQGLEPAGYQVTCVTTAADAVNRIDEVVPQVIVLDLSLPDEGSFHLMHQLREMPMWKDLPIIAVASIQRIEDVQRAIRIGATDFITKPINAEALLDRVRKRVGRVPPSRV